MLIKIDEKLTTNFQPSNDEDVNNKAYLDTKISKIAFQISYIEKDYTKLNCIAKHSL